MADSDNTTTLPFVTRRRNVELSLITDLRGSDEAIEYHSDHDAEDPAVRLLREWRHVQRVASILCRLQQKLEHRLIAELGHRGQSPVEVMLRCGEVKTVRKCSELDRLVVGERLSSEARAEAEASMERQLSRWDAMDREIGYSVAREAEIEAITTTLKLQDKLLATPASTLPGVVAKLEMIAGADQDIDDPTDFPWPHITSVLDDLKRIAGDLPQAQFDRSQVRSEIARYRANAVRLLQGSTAKHLATAQKHEL